MVLNLAKSRLGGIVSVIVDLPSLEQPTTVVSCFPSVLETPGGAVIPCISDVRRG
jgi:hypothetical protein|eukprot:SAG25_NODE_533_length_7143_cov_4.173623_10_plen_55_part_00